MESEPCNFSLGFSPCPNDTFIFNALVSGRVCNSALNFTEPVLADVETLNERAMEGCYDVTKLSFHALGHVLDRYVLLRSGSALGRGCGPLLVSRKSSFPNGLNDRKIAIPGQYTTAVMLLKLYDPTCTNLVPMRFDKIMPAVAGGKVDAGLIIHESRFTYKYHGLKKIIDLGEWWEQTTALPIPLGGIAAKREIGPERIKMIEACIRQSIKTAFAQPELARGYVCQHAQEMEDSVIDQHIALYVNDFSVELGSEGERAVNKFFELARSAGFFPDIQKGQSLFI